MTLGSMGAAAALTGSGSCELYQGQRRVVVMPGVAVELICHILDQCRRRDGVAAMAPDS